ncbi:MAG: aldehyde ferredoxin oxidoreductase C-terminal domain-containing protein, partial [Chloroflexi bacterium]|nr:aldehyde ferredoxin oxidoreductase C-terminal domain-containing protein [Chloroflexota bacterium]
GRTMLERGGEGTPTHPCMPGCVIRCSNIFPDAQGKRIVSPLEYENLVMLGPNLGIFSIDDIARLNYLCNDYGIDTVEIGAAIGVAMAGDILQFGDYEGAVKTLNEVAEGTLLGRVIGQGAVTAGRVFGVDRVPAVKGQSMPAYDPRAVKGIGVTYATSPMGADHTAGHTVSSKVDHHLPEGQIEASRNSQIIRAAYDSVCICNFTIAGIGDSLQLITDLVNAVHGTNYEPDYMRELGRDVLRTERAFNKAAGFTNAHDRYPDFFRTEKLPPFDVIVDVSQEEIDHFFDGVDG